MEDKVDYEQGCRTRQPAYVARRAGTTTLRYKVNFIPQSGTMNMKLIQWEQLPDSFCCVIRSVFANILIPYTVDDVAQKFESLNV